MILMWSTYSIIWLHIYGEEYLTEKRARRTYEQLPPVPKKPLPAYAEM